MVRLVDVSLDAGDPNKAVTALNDAVTESRAQTTTRTEPAVTKPTTDARFAGKTTEELVQMYTNLESHSGRLASQLGETRGQLNQIIIGKRENDLRQNGGAVTRQPAEIKPTDLLSNPTETIERYLSARGENPEVQTLKDRLAQLERSLGETRFSSNHKNAEQVTADPAFAAWVQQTPLRSRLAQNAAAGDYGAADALLTEYTAATAGRTNTVTTARDRAQDLASRVGLEGNTTGNDGTKPTSKTFRRQDLIALRINNPELYESPAYQKEIVKAYIENRVVD